MKNLTEVEDGNVFFFFPHYARNFYKLFHIIVWKCFHFFRIDNRHHLTVAAPATDASSKIINSNLQYKQKQHSPIKCHGHNV